MFFIDFEKAFDSIHRDCIWTALRNRAVPEKIICKIRAAFEGVKCRVHHKNKTNHTLRKDEKCIARKAMQWNRLIIAGRLPHRETWRRTVAAES